MGNSLFIILSIGCFCAAFFSALGLIRDHIKSAKERRGTLRQNENKTGEESAEENKNKTEK